MSRRRAAVLLTLGALCWPAAASAAPTWLPPVSAFDADATGVLAGMADDGTSLIVRTRDAGSTDVLEAVVRPPGGAPSPPREVARSAAGRYLLPFRAWGGPDGTFVVEYLDTDDRNSFNTEDVRLAVVDPDSLLVDRFTPSGYGSPISLKLALDGHGRAYLATQSDDGRIGIVRRAGGGSEELPAPTGRLPTGDVLLGTPAVAVMPDDRLLFTYGVATTVGCTRQMELRASRDVGAGTPSVDRLASSEITGTRNPVNGDCEDFQGRALAESYVYAEPDGGAAVFAFWLDPATGRYTVTAYRRPAGGAWGPEETVTTLPTNSTGNYQFSVAGARMSLSFFQNDAGSLSVRWVARNADGTWQPPRTVLDGDALVGLGVTPLADGGGLVVAADSDGDRLLTARRVLPDGTQQDPVVLASGLTVPAGSFVNAVATAADRAGNAIAVVYDTAGVRYRGFDGAGPVLDGVTIPGAGATGEARAFSLGAAHDVWSAVGTPTWSFGDGASAAGNAVAHAFAAPGRYSASVTVADAVGNTTTASGPVEVTGAPSGPPAPPARPSDTTAPRLTKRPRVNGGTLTVSVSEPARVVATITRSARGVRRGRRCVAPPRRKSKAKTRACTRQVPVATVRQTLAKAGAAKLLLPAKARRTPGAYTITLTVSDAAGNRTTTSVTYRVRRAR